ncbi:putative mediator of RNA polymerase II transcription subunit 26 [Daphnia pulex]|uniref:putative mediator of RNA polymerase II transcription subunit 26 n=1 Tax=Daphnia pulex TaxID=6669 RepID=UPI001EDD3E13|nr:putative mediator of RNA polymerase II transcription subunit 26 [Daphnia pulex]
MNRYTSESNKSLGIPFSNGMLIGGEIVDPRYDTDPRSRIEQLTTRNLNVTIPNHQTFPGNNPIHFNPDMRNNFQLTYSPTIVVNIGDEERRNRNTQSFRRDEQRVMEHGRFQERIPPHYAPERYPNRDISDRYPSNYYSDSPYPERNEHDYHSRRERPARVSLGSNCNHQSENNRYPDYHSENNRNYYYESNRNVSHSGCDRNQQHCDHYSNNQYPVYHSGNDRNQHCDHYYQNRNPDCHSHSEYDRNTRRHNYSDHEHPPSNIERSPACVQRVQRKSVTRDLVGKHVPRCQPAVHQANPSPRTRCSASPAASSCPKICQAKNHAKNIKLSVSWFIPAGGAAAPDLRQIPAADVRPTHESDNPDSAPDPAQEYDDMDPTAQDTDVLQEHDDTVVAPQQIEEKDQEVGVPENVDEPHHEPQHEQDEPQNEQHEPQYEQEAGDDTNDEHQQHEQDEPHQIEQHEPQYEQEAGDDTNDEHQQHLYPNIQDLQEPLQEPDEAPEMETATVEGKDEGLVQEPEDLSVPEEDDQHYDEDVSEAAPNDPIDEPVDPIINVPDSYVDEIPPKSRKGFMGSVSNMFKSKRQETSDRMKEGIRNTAENMKQKAKDAAERQADRAKEMLKRKADAAKEMRSDWKKKMEESDWKKNMEESDWKEMAGRIMYGEDATGREVTGIGTWKNVTGRGMTGPEDVREELNWK